MGVEDNRSQLVAALARVAGGERAALQIVYRDTSAKLFGVCLRILNDRSEAEGRSMFGRGHQKGTGAVRDL